MVYCRSDAACLCLSCDRSVHSANALSKRHSRTLVCERCNAQPATVRCVEERVSLCQNCDWSGHNNNNNNSSSSSSNNHKRQTISCYSGCPSSSELASIWSFCLELAGQSGCEQEMGMMNIDDDGQGNQNCNEDRKDVVAGSSSRPETMRYASRKARADVRRRVKGRFVKAGEAYDYDPLTPTRSY
ncbi:hypothetical protein F2Q68_00018107 [Brassica cretica]|uniref:B box-type domain-containing protein n=1 Tax=Brassica cretica TaxID=69181 RepID=A0A8S9HN17_BRACR|nr:hypothetical protein F2Q68_00018107 [Brassica cretica]